MITMRDDQIKQAVRRHYAARMEEGSSCCGSGATFTCCGGEAAPNVTLDLLGYDAQELTALPEDMTQSAFGCGNPLAFAGVCEGDVVLDLGSGAGMDAILAAKKVGLQGKVIGVDMTPEMVTRARANAARAGVADVVEFRLGEIEALPVADASVDWIISNCVINLSPDKPRVFAEAYRVLKPGGKLLVSDIVASNLPPALRDDLTAWAECVAGAMEEQAYLAAVRSAGFADVRVVERVDQSALYLTDLHPGEAREPAAVPRLSSIRVSAAKPSL